MMMKVKLCSVLKHEYNMWVTFDPYVWNACETSEHMWFICENYQMWTWSHVHGISLISTHPEIHAVVLHYEICRIVVKYFTALGVDPVVEVQAICVLLAHESASRRSWNSHGWNTWIAILRLIQFNDPIRRVIQCWRTSKSSVERPYVFEIFDGSNDDHDTRQCQKWMTNRIHAWWHPWQVTVTSRMFSCVNMIIILYVADVNQFHACVRSRGKST